MSRTMPDKCPDCGQITDWNDFGAEDGSSESQCVCPPRVGGREWFWVEGQRWLFDDDAGWVRGDGEPAPPRVLAGLKRLFARPSPFRSRNLGPVLSEDDWDLIVRALEATIESAYMPFVDEMEPLLQKIHRWDQWPPVTFTSEPSVDNGGSQPTDNPQVGEGPTVINETTVRLLLTPQQAGDIVGALRECASTFDEVERHYLLDLADLVEDTGGDVYHSIFGEEGPTRRLEIPEQTCMCGDVVVNTASPDWVVRISGHPYDTTHKHHGCFLGAFNGDDDAREALIEDEDRPSMLPTDGNKITLQMIDSKADLQALMDSSEIFRKKKETGA